MMMTNSELAGYLAYISNGTRFANQVLNAAVYLNKTTAEKFKIELTIDKRYFQSWIESGTNNFSSMTTTLNSYFYNKKFTEDWTIFVSFFAYKEHRAFLTFVFNFDSNYQNVSANSCYENIIVLHRLFGNNMFDSLKNEYLKKSFIEDLNKFSLKELNFDPSTHVNIFNDN